MSRKGETNKNDQHDSVPVPVAVSSPAFSSDGAAIQDQGTEISSATRFSARAHVPHMTVKKKTKQKKNGLKRKIKTGKSLKMKVRAKRIRRKSVPSQEDSEKWGKEVHQNDDVSTHLNDYSTVR